MHNQGYSRYPINEELLSYFKQYPDSLMGMNHFTKRFGKDMHNHLVNLERNELILRSKVIIGDKPVTHWQLNGNLKTKGQIDTNSELERNKSFIDYRGSNLLNRSDLIIEVEGKNFDKRRSFIKPKQNNDNWERGKYSSSGKSLDFQEKISDKIESDSQKSDIKVKKILQSNKNLNSSEFKQETEIINKIESDSSRSDMKFTDFPRSKLNPNSPEPEKEVMNTIEFDSPRHDRIYTKIPKSKLNPNSPEFKPQFPNRSNEKNIETEYGTPSSQLSNNLSLEFMTALTKNPVSVLYEFCQQRGMICEFKIVEMEGPSHKPRISTAVFLNGKKYETVVTSNKKEGKRKAADLAIRSLISEGLFAKKLNQSINCDSRVKTREYPRSNVGKNSNSPAIYDHIASLVYNKLAEVMKGLCPNEGLSLAGRKVVSAIIMQNEKYDTFEVVSLATGNRCITGDKLSLHGSIINDSHAEIIARRSFMYFLYKQLNAHLSGISKSMNLFEEMWSNQNSMNRKIYFKVKDHFKFHLYISTAPCGDGALFCSKESANKKDETSVILSNDHEPIFENTSQGLLRTKIEGGEGTIPVPVSIDCCCIQTLDGILRGERLRTMSCSDKIARWNYLGIQGALLEIFMQPIFLKSIILGNLFNAGHLSRAVCCRLEKFQLSPLSGLCKINHPDLVNVYIGELHREIDKSNELSINWCYGENTELVDGVTGELSMKTQTYSTKSRLSKASLFHEFHKIYKMLKYQLCISNLTYSEVKSLSRSYDDKKKALYLKFHCAKYGSWVCKPIEQSQFKNILSI